MGDTLDDYLDGLSSGQRFNPLPYGPYHGSKSRRQWHQMADSEREQAIYEARMIEEEESASEAAAAAGASAEGGSSPVPEKLILDRRFVPDTPQGLFAPPSSEPVILSEQTYPTEGALDLTTMAVEYPTQTQAETFGTSTTPDGNVTNFEDQFTGVVSDNISVVVTNPYNIQQQDPTLLDTVSILAQPNDVVHAINTGGEGHVFIAGNNESGEPYSEWGDYPGYYDWATGFAKPAYAIGGKYAVVFRALVDFSYFTNDNLNSIFYISAFPDYSEGTSVYFSDGVGQKLNAPVLDQSNKYYYLYIDINTNETTQQILENIEASYQSQGGTKYWSYGIVEITGDSV